MDTDFDFFDDFPESDKPSLLSDQRLAGKDFPGFLETNAGETIIGVWQSVDSGQFDHLGAYLIGNAEIVDYLFDLGNRIEQGLPYWIGTLDPFDVDPQNLRGSGFISFEDASAYLLSNTFLQNYGEIFESGGLFYVRVNY